MSLAKKKSWGPLWPLSTSPPNETLQERRTRQADAALAKARSDHIDNVIEAERKQKQRCDGPKILLLGQSESGKSTVLKNFQLHLAPKAFERETEIWRPVIHLNLVRSVNLIVNFLLSCNPSSRDSISTPSVPRRSSSGHLSHGLRRLCVRLAPLRQVERDLENSLSGGAMRSLSGNRGSLWKEAFATSTSSNSTNPGDGTSRRMIAALGGDIVALWSDSSVQMMLQTAGISLEEQPGFFLDQAVRIAKEDYRPEPDDVVRARVPTAGPEEHIIMPEREHGINKSKNWTIYDVGGTQSHRAAWAQFFDQVNTIIFLAPLSGFNQVLVENPDVNRLTDSVKLWQMLCSNKILSRIKFVLFLNKMDILDAKLQSGIEFSSYVTSYGSERPNETKAVSRCTFKTSSKRQNMLN
ncbi:hypothetical protein D9619_010847 [Psilocybe cf. subviscida]|uniref:G-alpha-domain-containing protein n=1 Tax=Psilocybe cf. subviscida TaxID=2480587 RepID=A0A8H5B8L6_9AGAR|nr:hypothetical protein D9619_010847 [Psilocybe cf. subviscida]